MVVALATETQEHPSAMEPRWRTRRDRDRWAERIRPRLGVCPVKEASLFDLVAEKLEECSALNRLEARGTLRIALKDSGFDAKSVAPDQLRVVIERLLPQHLGERGVPAPDEVCQLLVGSIPRQGSADANDSPEAIFARLGTS